MICCVVWNETVAEAEAVDTVVAAGSDFGLTRAAGSSMVINSSASSNQYLEIVNKQVS